MERNANFIPLTRVNAHGKCHGMQRTPRVVVPSSAFLSRFLAAEVLLLSLVPLELFSSRSLVTSIIGFSHFAEDLSRLSHLGPDHKCGRFGPVGQGVGIPVHK